jgi:hypothetical protein
VKVKGEVVVSPRDGRGKSEFIGLFKSECLLVDVAASLFVSMGACRHFGKGT